MGCDKELLWANQYVTGGKKALEFKSVKWHSLYMTDGKMAVGMSGPYQSIMPVKCVKKPEIFNKIKWVTFNLTTTIWSFGGFCNIIKVYGTTVTNCLIRVFGQTNWTFS